MSIKTYLYNKSGINLINHLPLSSIIANWKPGNRIALQNIKGKGIVSLQIARHYFKTLKLTIYYQRNLAGAALFFINKDSLVITEFHLDEKKKGIGSTVFNWLSLQAQKENKFILLDCTVNPWTAHLAFKYFTDVKVKINNTWVAKSEEEVIKMVSPPGAAVDLKGNPSPKITA